MISRPEPPDERPPPNSVEEFERALKAEGKKVKFVLKLYVAGTSPLSSQAVESVEAVCRECLTHGYELEVIDIHQQPSTIADAQIVAAPTLVRMRPLPVRRFIGNLGNRERVLSALSVLPTSA
jgi:circadian clock protein KaiB